MNTNDIVLFAGLWANSYTAVNIFMGDNAKSGRLAKLRMLILAPFLLAILSLVLPYLLAVALIKWIGDKI